KLPAISWNVWACQVAVVNIACSCPTTTERFSRRRSDTSNPPAEAGQPRLHRKKPPRGIPAGGFLRPAFGFVLRIRRTCEAQAHPCRRARSTTAAHPARGNARGEAGRAGYLRIFPAARRLPHRTNPRGHAVTPRTAGD